MMFGLHYRDNVDNVEFGVIELGLELLAKKITMNIFCILLSVILNVTVDTTSTSKTLTIELD